MTDEGPSREWKSSGGVMQFEEQITDSAKSSNFELSSILKKKLKDLPDVICFIEKLQTIIQKQNSKIKKLKRKLKKKTKKDVSTQTTDTSNVNSTKSITEQIKEAAEGAVQSSGFVYEETSGMYYDRNTGYYYNPEYGLYYDGNTGTYMSYNHDKQTYDFHSQVNVEKPAANTCSHSKRKSKFGEKQECKRQKNSNGDLEEGECSDDSGSVSESKCEEPADDNVGVHDISRKWPPCIRIIIEQTSVPTLKLGSLHMITFEGGTVGREGIHAILIPDINISKHHLKFKFDVDSKKYVVIDLGSRNGTILNGKRMSSSKQESEPQEVAHGSRIQLGSTILLCHIHAGVETCGLCEPGLVQTQSGDGNKKTKPPCHKEQLKLLKKKFGVSQLEERKTGASTSKYIDRAQVRRSTVGSQNEHEKTQCASLDQSISSENKGFKMLAKMGWSEGQPLGKNGEGVLEPVELKSNVGTRGIGVEENIQMSDISVVPSKENVWLKTKMRYEDLKSTQEDVFDESN